MKLQIGDKLPLFRVEDIKGNKINIKDYAGSKVLLSFYRFATCPFCNLRVHQLLGHMDKYEQQGLKVISFWQSTEENLIKHVEDRAIPFPMIADHKKLIYAQYGIEKDWKASIKLLTSDSKLALEAIWQNGTSLPKVDGDINLIPADFLVNPDLTIHQAYYGTHIGDHIPFTDIDRFLMGSQ